MEAVNSRQLLCLCSYKRFSHAKATSIPKAFRYISSFQTPLLQKTGYGTGPEARVKASIDAETEEYLQKNNLKPKEHPGIFHLKKLSIPQYYLNGIEKILLHEDRLKDIVEDSKIIRNYIWSRRLPIEVDKLRDKAEKIQEELRAKYEIMLPFLSQDESIRLEQRTKSNVLNRLFHTTYMWKPINFTRRRGLEYLLGRSAGEYAALCRIFNEISKRDPEFKPKTLCDFGSGVGTVTWAARSYWEDSLVEHLCADVSWEMNELAEQILRGGSKRNDHPIPALFFRQHLPESDKIQYDIVVSAFSLMELPTAKSRIEMIDKLWKKTAGYLVIAEAGTRAGFRVIMEARDYILRLDRPTDRPPNGHVFSPCPNNKQCPRFKFDTIPCNFEVKFRPIYPIHNDKSDDEKFCYVVLKRGSPNPYEIKWPRLVQEPMVKPRHIICRVCTKDAKISEVILTRKKHSQNFRLIAKRSGLGDLLPIHLTEIDHAGKESSDNNDE